MPWMAYPYPGEFQYTAAGLKTHWARLHAGDCEPEPQRPELWAAWALLHNGEFESAARAGLALGTDGFTLANRATCMYAAYLESDAQTRLDLFQQAAVRAQAQVQQDGRNASAWYWLAYALGYYSQDISVAKALAQGLGTRVREALEQTIQLRPQHAEAHLALGAFHAEVIDKVGSLIGSMTYGAKKEIGLARYQTALQLNPQSAFAMVEYGNALIMMDGDKRAAEAKQWFKKAIAVAPADATEKLQQDLARAELARLENGL